MGAREQMSNKTEQAVNPGLAAGSNQTASLRTTDPIDQVKTGRPTHPDVQGEGLAAEVERERVHLYERGINIKKHLQGSQDMRGAAQISNQEILKKEGFAT